MIIVFYIILFLWFAFWSAQAGRTISYLHENLDDWQDKSKVHEKMPEIVIAATIAMIGVWGWSHIFTLTTLQCLVMFAFFSVISLAGKESATWAYLNWEGHEGTPRDSTLRKVNDKIARWFGFKLGDEGYSWVWAFTKGLITTLPVCGFGALFLPLGKEIASHAKDRVPIHYSFWQESVGDGFGYTMACLLFLSTITIFLTGG